MMSDHDRITAIRAAASDQDCPEYAAQQSILFLLACIDEKKFQVNAEVGDVDESAAIAGMFATRTAEEKQTRVAPATDEFYA